jgi:error-prone DNA polymerase
VADHETMSLSTGPHPMALLRPSLPDHIRTSRDLVTDPPGSQVTIAGIVVARQRPGTAKGIVFLLLEDEHGMSNAIVPPEVYERDRIAVRAEPLLEVTGRLERREGTINVLATPEQLRAWKASAIAGGAGERDHPQGSARQRQRPFERGLRLG